MELPSDLIRKYIAFIRTTKNTIFLFLSILFVISCSDDNDNEAESQNEIRTIPESNPAITFATGLHEPEGLAFDNRGHLFVSNINGDAPGTISMIWPDGSVEEFAAGLITPNGLAFDSSGYLYVADFGEDENIIWDGDGIIFKISPEGEVTRFVDQGIISNPDALAFDLEGNLYVSDFVFPGAIYKVQQDGETEVFADGLSLPNGLAFSEDFKYLYVALTFPPGIARIPIREDGSAGRPEKVFSGFTFPDGIAFDRVGNLYVARALIPIISVLTVDGQAIDLITEGDLSFTTSIAFGRKGFDMCSLYIVNRGLEGKGNTISVSYVGIPGLAIVGP